ncbi:MAG: DUF1080 domain-containing protein [Acidobacteria bacterium]|nr:MAG: DUF1080 domain-containing protein [Acidobacteriota bacterium]
MRKYSGSVVLFFLFICPALRASDPPSPKQPTAPLVLFNGKNLDNFYTYLKTSRYEDPKGVFRVVDGQIRISGEDWGAITTRDAFRDYHLIVEWKWGGATFEPRKNAARDSGILVHGVGADGAAGQCWLESIEHQVIEGGCGDIILVAGANRPSLTVEARSGEDRQLYWKPGDKAVTRDQGRFNWFGRDPQWKDVLGFRGRSDVEKPVGEWNRSEVVCDGSSIVNIVNGVVVNHGTNCSHTAGKIQIQSEGAEIIVRRVELRPVDKAEVERLLLRATFGFSQQTQPAQARIKIDTDRVIGEVHPHLFGNFAEHLGRCIYGGIYEPGSRLSDEEGYRKDVMDAAKGLGVTLLRWPGGNFVSGYNWKDGVGPRDQRPVRPEGAWGSLEPNTFGTDEFLRYCEKLGFEPYVCINAGLGTIEDARNWVEYCNETRDTYWAQQRRKNGRKDPWKVQYWGLGNEIDGPWQLGHKNAEDYTKFALEAAKAMRRVDDSIKLIASGSSNFRGNADWIGWNRAVLEKLRGEIDYISLHTYIGNRENNFERFLAVSQDIDERIEIVEGMIRAVQSGRPDQRPIYIAYDEWNVWYRATGGTEFALGKTGLEEQYNYEDALAMGMFFNSFFRHADSVKMANLAQLVNVIAPIFTNKEGLFLQPIYFPIAEYAKQRGHRSLDLLVSSPTYQIGNRAPLGYLDVSGTHDPKTGMVYLNVLNRSEKQDISAAIENVEGRPNAQVEVWEMNHPDLKTVHTFGADTKVRPATRTATVSLAGNTFNYTFPKHSLTILKMKVEAR